MKFIIKRHELLDALQSVIGAVERRHTLAILGNVLFQAKEGVLFITASDLEIEMICGIRSDQIEDFDTTIPARKLFDICKALPEGSEITMTVEETKVIIVSDRSKFTLLTLPAKDFPGLDDINAQHEFSIPQKALKSLIDKTSFAMAQQDVRYYLNGILMELSTGLIKLVATDGHRLALSEYKVNIELDIDKQIIIPRKGVMELARLLDASDSPVRLTLSQNHIKVETDKISFTSKLIDGKFPDYNRVIPVDGNKSMTVSRDLLKRSMSRISILSNEKYRGIRLTLTTGNLAIQANNPDQEEAEEELAVNYDESEIEIGFNVTYIIDVLNVLTSEEVELKLKDANSSCIVSDASDPSSLYVVMPMRL
ncbi:MAG: DNA polymerase-3 subunit beta [Candidatus Azotimanducaceae bacterium]|jgi:DNA polymerase-3 subunit beta